jgi:hypothetical protein
METSTISSDQFYTQAANPFRFRTDLSTKWQSLTIYLFVSSLLRLWMDMMLSARRTQQWPFAAVRIHANINLRKFKIRRSQGCQMTNATDTRQTLDRKLVGPYFHVVLQGDDPKCRSRPQSTKILCPTSDDVPMSVIGPRADVQRPVDLSACPSNCGAKCNH